MNKQLYKAVYHTFISFSTTLFYLTLWHVIAVYVCDYRIDLSMINRPLEIVCGVLLFFITNVYLRYYFMDGKMF